MVSLTDVLLKIRLVTPPTVMFCVPNGRLNEPAPSTDSVDRRTPALTVTRGRTCQVSCTNPAISFASVGGSSGPRRARVTRKRLGVSYATATLAAPPDPLRTLTRAPPRVGTETVSWIPSRSASTGAPVVASLTGSWMLNDGPV